MEAWHCILVPADKLSAIRAQRAGGNIDVTDFGRILQYRDHQGRTVSTFDWGTDPPKMIQMWLYEHYSQ
jgi:hypothetical protein